MVYIDLKNLSFNKKLSIGLMAVIILLVAVASAWYSGMNTAEIKLVESGLSFNPQIYASMIAIAELSYLWVMRGKQ